MANMTTQEILQGIKDWAAPKVIYDISAAHNNTKYTDLADALGTNGGNIPQEYKKGGITVRYVQSNDNKYVQYRLMSDTFNTTVTNWQGVDDEPTAGSDNLVKSRGVNEVVKSVFDSLSRFTVVESGQEIANKNIIRFVNNVYIDSNGNEKAFTNSYATLFIPVKDNTLYSYNNGYLSSGATICYYDSLKKLIGTEGSFSETVRNYNFTTPSGCCYIRASVLAKGIANFNITANEAYRLDLNIGLKELQDYIAIKNGSLYQADADNDYKLDYYLNQNGEEQYFQGAFRYTLNYVLVTPNTKYLYKGYLSGKASIVFYDSNKNYISGICPDNSGVWTEHEFTTPSNCYYIRYTCSSSADIYLAQDILSDFLYNNILEILKKYNLINLSGELVQPSSDNTYKLNYFLASNDREIPFNGYAYTENYILVTPGVKYLYVGRVTSSAGISFYDINKNYIGHICPSDDPTTDVWTEHEFTTPDNCCYIRCSYIGVPGVNIYLAQNITISSTLEKILSLIKDIKPEDIDNITYDTSFIGDIDTINIHETDYLHIIFYGQSLSTGTDTVGAITTTPISGCYMIGSSLEDYGDSVVKNPLVNTEREHPVVSTVNSFARLFRQLYPSKDFFASSCGSAGAYISQLQKGTSIYNGRFINQINRIYSCVSEENKTIACPVIIFLQGENDVQTAKDVYKQNMLQLKNDMQEDIMNKYGQSQKPMFCIYSVSSAFNSQEFAAIPMAQMEFALENEDVFLLNPYYAMPSYNRTHMSKNGYRWYGSLTSKSIFNIFIKRQNYSTIIPQKFTLVDKRTIAIDFYVPIKPLVLDTTTICPSSGGTYGFYIFKNSVKLSSIKVSIKNGSTIILSTNEDLNIETDDIEIYYATGNRGDGIGNLRDSDEFKSYYIYIDDTNEQRSDGTGVYYHPTQLYGKKYPLYNWCAPFYKKLRD